MSTDDILSPSPMHVTSASTSTVNGTTDDDVILIDEMIWADASDKFASNELAHRPRGDLPDACGCFGENDCDQICTDESCVLFACQEECHECLPQCGNQRITNKQWRSVQVIDAGPKGKGLQAMEDLKKGDFILEYVGKAIRKAYLERLFSRYKTERMLYIMALDSDIFIDARAYGGKARYINHSCDPNCRVERWNVRGVLRAGIFATRDIKQGEELSFDYKWDRKRGRAATKCHCGSPNCRGTLEVPKSMEEEELEHQLKAHWLKPIAAKAGAEIINRTIRIYSQEYGEYFSADICKYDDENGKHLVMYRNSLEEEWEDLAKEDWQLLDEEASSIFIIGKKQKQEKDIVEKSLLGITKEEQQEEMRHFQNFFFVSTAIKNELNGKGFIDNVRIRFGCSVEVERIVKNELKVEDIPQADSNENLEWKIVVSGVNVEKAHGFIEKNIAKLRHQQQTQEFSQKLLQNPQCDSSIDPSALHEEVIIPRCTVDCVYRKLGSVRDRCKSVNITFAPSESKSKKFGKIQLDATLVSDLKSAKDLLWSVILKSCEETNAPKAPSGFFKDFGFFGGELSSEAFQMLVNISDKNRLNQEANEDLRQSSFFASFESTQHCTVWVQSENDMGRIDASNRIIAEFDPNAPRKMYFGCDPGEVPKLWKLVERRANDHLRGIRYLHLGADRQYQKFMMKDAGTFFTSVKEVTGATVTIDSMTGDHLRVDGGTEDLVVGDWDSEQTLSPSDIAILAEELILLQIEFYRDHCTRVQSWLFGRDWSLAAIPRALAKEEPSTPKSPRTLTGKSNRFEPRNVANACLEIAEIVKKAGLIASVGGHAAVIMYRFLKLVGENDDACPGLKIRDILMACIFLANKAQKVMKWKKVDVLLESAYPVFFPGSKFNREDQGAVNFEKKVIQAESEVLKMLDYDIFWKGVEWVAEAAVESTRISGPMARNALELVLSGPVLAAGADLWLKFGEEYIFGAIMGFLAIDLEPLFVPLSLMPLKVSLAAEIIAESVEANGNSRKSTRAMFNGGIESFLNNLVNVKSVCVRNMRNFAALPRDKLIDAGQSSVRYQMIGQRDNRRYAFKELPESVVSEGIVPIIDAICAESKCRIFVAESEHPGHEDLIIEGSWRALAIAERVLSAACSQVGGTLPSPVDSPPDDSSFQLNSKSRSGFMTMDDICTSDGWECTIQSKIVTGEPTFGRKVGGKACEAGRIQESHMRKAGLRWWIPPMYAPSPSGCVYDMHCVRTCVAKDRERFRQLIQLSNLGMALVGEEELANKFPKLSTFCRSSKDGQHYEDRFVAVSMQRWPPEKIDNKEQGKKDKNNSPPTGFSPAALQELQLLTQLHSLIPSPTGHPNLTLPVAVSLPQVAEDNGEAKDTEEFGETKVDDIFSLFRSSEENERSARKEKKRRDRSSGPHLVFDPIPFLLTRVVQRSSKKRRDELEGGTISPYLFSAWFHDLLSALVHCHTNHVILRSAQTDQILIDHSGVAKVAGFYRATVLPLSERTKQVNPLRSTKSRKDKNDEGDDVNPYSAPELLLGSLKHTKETDIWAIGSMMAHLLLGKPIFLGKERSALLLSMFKIVGSPGKDNYPDACKFPFAVKAAKKYKRGVERAFERMMREEDFSKHKKAIDLMAEMLHLDPTKRITAVEALNHEYMHDYYQHHETKSFRDQYVNDWMDMKKDLVHSSRAEKEDAQLADKTLKRKAMLEAAAGADDDIDDDLYDMDDMFDRSDSIGVEHKKAKI